MKEVNSTLKAMQANVKSLSSEYVTNDTKAANLKKQNEQLREIEKQLSEKMKTLSAAVSRSGEAYDQAKEKLENVIKIHGKESDEARKAQNAVASAAVTYNNYRTQLSQTEVTLNQTQQAIRDNNAQLKEMSKIDMSGLVSGLKAVGSAAATVGKSEFAALKSSVQAVTTEFKLAVDGLAAYTSAIVATSGAVGKFAVDSGATFEQSLSELQAISLADAETMEKFSLAAQEMGRTTSKTASESAQALKFMSLAGWQTEEMLVGLQPMIKATEAGGMDLATASDLITDSLAAYGKTADDMQGYLNILAKAQSSSNSSMRQMLEAYVEVGGTFKNLNVPMEESAAILGTLANRGIKGSEAGNKLSSALINLVGANKNADAALNQLGVSAWDENGEFIGLAKTIDLLGDKLSQLSDEDMMKFEAKIGGKMQIDTLQALISGTNEEYDELHEKLQDVDGVLNQTAETMLQNFNGAVTLMKSALEGLGIAIFENFRTPLSDTVRDVTDWVGRISKVIESGGSVVGITKRISAEIRSELIDALDTAGQILPDITAIFNQILFEATETVIQTLPQFTENVVLSFAEGMFNALDGLVSYAPDMAAAVAGSAEMFFDYLLPEMQSLSENFVSKMPDIFGSFAESLNGEKIGQIYLAGLDVITTLASGIADNIDVIAEQAGNLIETVFSGITERLPEIVSAGMTIVMSLLDSIVSEFPTILETGVEMILSLIDGMVSNDNLTQIVGAAFDIITAVIDSVTSNLDRIVQLSLRIVIALIEGVTQNLDKIVSELPVIIDAVVKAIINPQTLGLLAKAAVEIVEALALALVETIDVMIESVDSLVDSIVDAFMEFDWLALGIDIITGILSGFDKVGNVVFEKVKDVGEKIFGGFKDFFDINSPSKLMQDKIGYNVGIAVPLGAEEGIEDGTKNISRASSGLENNILDSLSGLYSGINSSVAMMSSGFRMNAENSSRVINVTVNVDSISSDQDINELGYKIAAAVRESDFAGGM